MGGTPVSSLSSGAVVSGATKDEILHAIQTGNLERVKSLVTTPAMANIKDRSGYTLLYVATNLDKAHIAKWLVSCAGADVNLHSNSHNVLSLAIAKSNYELFHFFLEHKAECIGRNQLNMLHDAVVKGQYAIVERLIEKGADPNQLNGGMHITPLHIAVAQKNKRLILLLLESGACANLPDKKGNTAVHLACSQAQDVATTATADIVHCLLDNTECDLRLRNAVDETPLDILWICHLREGQPLDARLLDKMIELGALFSMPWNVNVTAKSHACFIRCMALLCKYRIGDLFVANERPLLNELVVHGFWCNLLIVAIKSMIVDYKAHLSATLEPIGGGKESEASLASEAQMEAAASQLFAAIEIVLLSDELALAEADLCSTFYMLDDVDDLTVYKLIKHVYESRTSLKSQARHGVRRQLAALNADSVDKLDISGDLKRYLLYTPETTTTTTTTTTSATEAVTNANQV